ncbi:hypothetical protein ACLKA7_012327 [Drosophila subpalustris]
MSIDNLYRVCQRQSKLWRGGGDRCLDIPIDFDIHHLWLVFAALHFVILASMPARLMDAIRLLSLSLTEQYPASHSSFDDAVDEVAYSINAGVDVQAADIGTYLASGNDSTELLLMRAQKLKDRRHSC